MVCYRCKTIVESELDAIGIPYFTVEQGKVNTKEPITPWQRTQLFNALQKSGFELLSEQKNGIIEKLKRAIVDLERFSDADLKTSYRDFIKLKVHKSYISLNKLFAEIEGITIEIYIINHKIEQVKNLLVNTKLSLSEIALKFHYSNTAQLSCQFKSITGLTPFHFRELLNIKTLNNLCN